MTRDELLARIDEARGIVAALKREHGDANGEYIERVACERADDQLALLRDLVLRRAS